MPTVRHLMISLALTFTFLASRAPAADVGLFYKQDLPQAKFPAAEISAALKAHGDPQRQASAVAYLTAASGYWKQYADVATSQYRPQLLTRIGKVDLQALTAKVEADVEIAKAWKRPN